MLSVLISIPQRLFLGMELCVDVLSNVAGVDVCVDDCSGRWPLRSDLLIIRDAVDIW